VVKTFLFPVDLDEPRAVEVKRFTFKFK